MTRGTAVERTQSDPHQAFVLRHAIEQRLQVRAAVMRQRFGDRIRQRGREQRAPQVLIARKPAQRQPVHQRQRQISGRDEREHERHEESKLKAERVHDG